MSSICESIVYDVHPSNTLCVQGVAADFFTADVQSLGTLVVSSKNDQNGPPWKVGPPHFGSRTCVDFRAALALECAAVVKTLAVAGAFPQWGCEQRLPENRAHCICSRGGGPKNKRVVRAPKETKPSAHGPAIIERAILLMPRASAGNLSSPQLSGF